MDNAHVIAYWREAVRKLDRAMACGDTLLTPSEYTHACADLYRMIDRETSYHG